MSTSGCPYTKAGSIFDNVLVTDDVAYAAQFAEDTWGKSKAGPAARRPYTTPPLSMSHSQQLNCKVFVYL